MMRAKEQGVVVRFLSGNRVEIEIEDGFRIPVMQSELVVVSPMEAERFTAPEQAAALRDTLAPQRATTPLGTSAGQVLASVGLYLAYVPQNDRDVALYLVNNTDWEVLLTVAEDRDGKTRGLQSAALKPKTLLKLVGETYVADRFEQWPTLLIQALYFRPGLGQPARAPLQKRLKPRPQAFVKSKQNVPLLNQPGHVFQLDDEGSNAAMTPPETLRAALLEPKTEPNTMVVVEKPAAVVDLHIEKLVAGTLPASSGDMVTVQLLAFEKNLENALATGMPHITFIHGVGSGKLRQELHRQLSRHPQVRFFEDAQKDKFGYGATKVTFK